jgi:hypothetical protein
VPRPVYLGRLRLPTKMQMQAQPAWIAADKVEPCPNRAAADGLLLYVLLQKPHFLLIQTTKQPQ